MRKQYYFRHPNRGLLAWDVDRLVKLSGNLPRRNVQLAEIRESLSRRNSVRAGPKAHEIGPRVKIAAKRTQFT